MSNIIINPIILIKTYNIKLNMKYLLVTFLLILAACTHKPEKPQFTAQEILELSQKKHDPNGNWSQAELSVHIQEPRIQNELRYSVLTLNNKNGYFSLIRDSEVGMVERIIDENGKSSVLLNGSNQIEEKLKEEYRLGADRNEGYRSFYELMYGLPMSINEEVWGNIQDAEFTTLEGQEVYKVRVELKEAMISKYWELLIDPADYSLVALKFDHSDDPNWPDEIIRFEGEYSFDGITIPRFRHWYEEESGEYLGSDVILKKM